jgi:CheY-like chemotaxis protein
VAPEKNMPVMSPAPIEEALIGEFLATLSRELRGPLAPLRASLEMLKLSQPPGAAMQIMERQVGDLVKLVDDLTEMSGIAQGGVELARKPVRLDTVLDTAVAATRALTTASKLRVTVSTPQDPIMLSADSARLAQLFGHLLSNAAKHSEPGATITVEARREGREAVISITDTGEGIAPELLPRLFGVFARGERSDKPNRGGLGIGLAMVRRLAALHDGSVAAESEGPGKGSRFTVRLPLATASIDAAPVNILVVDDNRDAAESIGMLLGHLGAEVRVAEDGTQALAAFTVCRPNIVFLDIGMPGMDGYELARRMRAMPAEPPVTLVALTGWGQDDDRKRVLGAGFDHHLVKPAQMGALQSLLDSMKMRSA